MLAPRQSLAPITGCRWPGTKRLRCPLFASLSDEELGHVAEVPWALPVRPHRGSDRRLGLLPAFGRELGGRHSGENPPRQLKVNHDMDRRMQPLASRLAGPSRAAR